MKILESEDFTKWTHTWSCLQCKSKLEADHQDLCHEMIEESDCRDSWKEDSYFVNCIVCQYKQRIKYDSIPFVLRKSTKEKLSK